MLHDNLAKKIKQNKFLGAVSFAFSIIAIVLTIGSYAFLSEDNILASKIFAGLSIAFGILGTIVGAFSLVGLKIPGMKTLGTIGIIISAIGIGFCSAALFKQ